MLLGPMAQQWRPPNPGVYWKNEERVLVLSDVPLTRDLVLVGGGHAHALVLKAWGMDPLPGARLTVINPGPTAPYTGMLPGHVAGHYGRDELEIDLVRLCHHAGARLILAPDWEPVVWTETERRKGQAWGLKTIESFHTHGTPPVKGRDG